VQVQKALASRRLYPNSIRKGRCLRGNKLLGIDLLGTGPGNHLVEVSYRTSREYHRAQHCEGEKGTSKMAFYPLCDRPDRKFA